MKLKEIQNHLLKLGRMLDSKRCDTIGLVKNCMFFTVLFGLIAHGYAFLNFTISHDSLCALHSLDGVKIQSGRFGAVIYKYITSSFVTLPWTAGIFSLIFVGIACILICRIFDLEKLWQIVLLSGILVTNSTFTSLTATYIHDLSADTFALLMSVIAVYAWKYLYKKQSRKLSLFLVSLFSIVTALSIYQAYISVIGVIILFILILDLLEGESFFTVVKAGLFAACEFVISGLIYIFLAKMACKASGLPMLTDNYNSLSNITNEAISLSTRMNTAYFNVLKALVINPISSFRYPIVVICNVCLLLFLFISLFKKIAKLGIKEKLLSVILIVLMPFVMNVSGFLNGTSHDLMIYAAYFIYILIMIFLEENSNKDTGGGYLFAILTIFMGLLIIQNIQTSNTIYMKKDVERQATISRVTSILTIIEQQEGYVYGETPVALIGGPLHNEKPMLSEGNIVDLTGCEFTQIDYSWEWDYYLTEVLNYQMNLCKVDEVNELQNRSEVIAMPCFPNNGGVKVIDGIIVVKLSEEKIE